MDPDPLLLSFILGNLLSASFLIPALGMLILLACSALVSGSEVAYFSLGPSDLASLRDDDSPSAKRILNLIEEPDIESGPRNLLATILVLNNFINIIIILLSTVVVGAAFPEGSLSPVAEVAVNVGAITFLLVLFGEVIPKVYATNYGLQLARVMSTPLLISERVFYIFWKPLVRMGQLIEDNFKPKQQASVSVEELEHALELTDTENRTSEEKKILEGIVTFGSKDVKQIMTPRMDVTAFDVDTPWGELFPSILECSFSRIPIFSDSIDEISGVLYIKDLLPHFLDPNIDWKGLLRAPFYVPEHKKIDDLLKEFQEKKIHLAVVVDEYGGTSGIVTLEDVLEEIVGEITDEFDEDDIQYSKLDELNYVFEGKTALIDMYRIMDIDGSNLEAAKGDSDTLAGFVLEHSGKIPLKGERLQFDDLLFTIEASDRRRIKRVKVSREEKDQTNEFTD
ncbi:MAG: gliding motility-associated protein GldE [Flavobacteriales bacterium]|nr:gliding motility-associated protein GldE [Flavobacteriales bacterium]